MEFPCFVEVNAREEQAGLSSWPFAGHCMSRTLAGDPSMDLGEE
jgi:hypothetical protein